MKYEYKFDVSISGKEIQCRAFTLEEYKGLIDAKINGTVENAINELIKNCTTARDLNRQESELLLVKLWSHSVGEVNHENTWTCPEGHETLTSINFTSAQVDDPEDLWYPLANFRLKLRYPKLYEDKNIALMIASCIEYIYVNGETISVEDLNDKEIDDLYSAITTDDMQRMQDMLLKPTVHLAVPVKCKVCGATHVEVIKGLKEFFRYM